MNRYTVERFSIDPDKHDGIGGPVQCWKPHIEVTGLIDMLTNREATAQNSFTEESTHVLITNHADYDIVNKDRIVVRGINHEVTFVDDPVGLGHHLEIYLQVKA